MVGRSVLGVPIARLVPWLVLLLGLATTLILYATIGRTLAVRREQQFRGEVARISVAINDAVDRQVSVLQATGGAVAANPGIRRDQFAAFYRHLALGGDAKAPTAIGLSLTRPWERRGELAGEARRRGVRNFAFRPERPRPEAHAIVLVEPQDDANRNVPGFDMHAEPVRARAMDEARKRNQAVMTTQVFLIQSPRRNKPAFLIYLPVQDPASGRSIGTVYSGIYAEELFGDLFATRFESVTDHVGLRLWTGDGDGKDVVYARDVKGEHPYRRTLDIDLPQVAQRLHAEIVATRGFGTPSVIQGWVPPVGVLLSVMLFALAGLLRRFHEASERREREQALLAEVGRLTARDADSEEALEGVAARVAATMAATCRIDLLEEGVALRTVTTRTQGREAIAILEREFPRLEHDLLFKEALATGRAQVSVDYPTSNPAHRARLDGLNFGPILIVPLRVGDRPVGAITLSRSKGARPFSGDETALAEAIAGRMALAIENVRLYHDLERRVVERTRDLEASNHELESFCYSVSHDLRTPLRSLDGFSRALQEDYGERLDAQGLDFIDRIRASAKRMDELITALLTLSRLTRREILPTDVDVSAMVREQLHDLDPEGRVRPEIEEGLTAHADPRMLAVVFDNLLTNAIKFSSRTENPTVAVGKNADGEIFVRDNGAGFDMAYAAKLFQPFERLHSVREFPGHGIGLATVERIVRRHGGEVRAEGRPNEGATFFMRFPDCKD